MEFTPELDALRLLSYRIVSSRNVSRVNQLISAEFNWTEFIRLMQAHRLCLPVWRNLEYLKEIPDDSSTRIKKLGCRSLLRGMKQTGQTIRLSLRFSERRIPVLFLKGACLSQTLYNAPAERQSSDIDLLISVSDFPRADRLLSGIGYTRVEPAFQMDAHAFKVYAGIRFHAAYRSLEGTRVELHWRLFNIPRMFPIGFEELWKERQSVELSGNRVPVPGHCHNMVFLLIHGSKHAWERLFWLKDIADYVSLLKPEELERISNYARKYRLHHIFYEASTLAAHVYRSTPFISRGAVAHVSGISLRLILSLYSARPSLINNALLMLRKFAFFNRHHRLSYVQSIFLSIYHQRRFGSDHRRRLC